jgi:hypothetical protein
MTVGPFGFGAITLFADAFDTIANLRAAVGINRVFDGAFVVIDEQARRRENLRELLFHPVELNGGGDGIGGATAELALVVNQRALRAQVHFGRRRGGQLNGRAIELVAMVRQIRKPAITSGLKDHKFSVLFQTTHCLSINKNHRTCPQKKRSPILCFRTKNFTVPARVCRVCL